MTPKEKANDLVQKFYFSLPNNGTFTGINNINQRWIEGKKCALIAVDEIIKSGLLLDSSVYVMVSNSIEYWNEVKQEIEKL